MTNLITPRALFSPTYLLNLANPELAPLKSADTENPIGVNRTIRRGDIAIWIFQDGCAAAAPPSWIAEIRPLVKSKPLILSSQNLAQLIMSARRPPVPNFMQIGSRGASR